MPVLRARDDLRTRTSSGGLSLRLDNPRSEKKIHCGMRSRTGKSQWELRNEKNKANVRWVFIIAVTGYFAYLLNKGLLPAEGAAAYFTWSYIGALVAAYALANAGIHLYLIRTDGEEKNLPSGFKYITMFLDLVVVSLVIVPTGGEKSIFFLLYIVVIISHSMRYGIQAGIVCLVALNFLYVGVLVFLHYPDLERPGLQMEILKMAGLWTVGIYIGYLSKRFETMQGEVEKYRKIILDLTGRKENE